jgi:hypothetical protein
MKNFHHFCFVAVIYAILAIFAKCPAFAGDIYDYNGGEIRDKNENYHGTTIINSANHGVYITLPGVTTNLDGNIDITSGTAAEKKAIWVAQGIANLTGNIVMNVDSFCGYGVYVQSGGHVTLDARGYSPIIINLWNDDQTPDST